MEGNQEKLMRNMKAAETLRDYEGSSNKISSFNDEEKSNVRFIVPQNTDVLLIISVNRIK